MMTVISDFLDPLQIESLIFFAIAIRFSVHCWQSLHTAGHSGKGHPPPALFLVSGVLMVLFSAIFFQKFTAEHALLAFTFAFLIGISCLDIAYPISFFIALLILRPWEIMADNPLMLAMPQMIGFYSMLVWLLQSLMRSRISLAWNRGIMLMLAFASWTMLSLLKSNTPTESGALYFDSFFRVVVIFFILVNCIENRAALRLARDCILISATGLAMVALFKYFSAHDFSSRLKAVGNLENSNDLAAILIMVLPMAVRRFSPWRSAQMLFVFCTTFAAIWLSQSRGAILAVAVMAASYLLLQLKNKKQGIALVALLFLSLFLLRTLLHRNSEDLHESTESRISYWTTGAKMAFYNPLLGVGFEKYPENYERYASKIKFESGKRTAHSTWILALAETGIPGFLFLISLYAVALLDAFRIRHWQPDLLYCLIGYGVAITFLSHTYLLYPYILIALTIAAGRMHRLINQGNKKISKQLALASVVLLTAFTPQLLLAAEAKPRASISAYAGGDKPIAGKAPQTQPGVLTLSGSRGETLNFLLKVEHAGCYRIQAPEKDKNVAVRIFQMPKIKTEHPSFPGAPVGSYYDPLVPVKPGERICGSEWLWGELAIATDATPGSKTGTILLVGGPEISWKLEVWPMIMGSFPSLPAYAELTTWFNLLGHYGKWHAGEGELAKKYLEEMQKHRIYPLKARVARPQVKKTANGSYSLEVNDSPKGSDSFAALVIENDKTAFIDFPSFEKKASQQETIQYWQAVENTIQKYHLQQRALCYFWDEPGAADFPQLIAQAQLAKKHAPHLKLLVTTDYQPKLEGLVDIFAPVINYYDAPGHPSAQKYEALRKSGHQVWWYASCMSHGCSDGDDSSFPDLVIDRPAAWIRSIAWLSSKYNISAFLYYSVNNGFQFSNKRDPWKSLWDFNGNGDGTLFYPGKPGKFPSIRSHMPIASIRLKLWREASFDAEYVKWMENLAEKPAWWNAELAKIISSPKSWSKNYQAYQDLRNRSGEYLAKLARGKD